MYHIRTLLATALLCSTAWSSALDRRDATVAADLMFDRGINYCIEGDGWSNGGMWATIAAVANLDMNHLTTIITPSSTAGGTADIMLYQGSIPAGKKATYSAALGTRGDNFAPWATALESAIFAVVKTFGSGGIPTTQNDPSGKAAAVFRALYGTVDFEWDLGSRSFADMPDPHSNSFLLAALTTGGPTVTCTGPLQDDIYMDTGILSNQCYTLINYDPTGDGTVELRNPTQDVSGSSYLAGYTQVNVPGATDYFTLTFQGYLNSFSYIAGMLGPTIPKLGSFD